MKRSNGSQRQAAPLYRWRSLLIGPLQLKIYVALLLLLADLSELEVGPDTFAFILRRLAGIIKDFT